MLYVSQLSETAFFEDDANSEPDLLRSTAEPAEAQVHLGVFKTLFAVNILLLAIAWVTFGQSLEAAFMIAICAVYVLMYFGTPYVMVRVGIGRVQSSRSWMRFLRGSFQTLTGPVKGWEALVQVCLIPAAITFGFAGFALVLNAVR